jgi:hypothetical protein
VVVDPTGKDAKAIAKEEEELKKKRDVFSQVPAPIVDNRDSTVNHPHYGHREGATAG